MEADLLDALETGAPSSCCWAPSSDLGAPSSGLGAQSSDGGATMFFPSWLTCDNPMESTMQEKQPKVIDQLHKVVKHQQTVINQLQLIMAGCPHCSAMKEAEGENTEGEGKASGSGTKKAKGENTEGEGKASVSGTKKAKGKQAKTKSEERGLTLKEVIEKICQEGKLLACNDQSKTFRVLDGETFSRRVQELRRKCKSNGLDPKKLKLKVFSSICGT